jgi:8-oxo-dGTP pyrophosphatase MutT (NUDIX family)
VETTWDGLPVSREKPFAACVVVWRRAPGGREFLVLHRHHGGPEHEGDWAWTPPSGGRLPGEEADAAASRELHEETGLALPLTRCARDPSDEVVLYVAEAPTDVELVLDAEHDRFDWRSLEEAVRSCLPTSVGLCLELAAAELGD